jgi:hypothetical protein
VFAASSLGGAAREQYAAMEAGGGAVAAPPKRGQLADRPAAGRRAASADTEQYAAMKTGGGALAAPPKKVAARRRPASRRPPRGERHKRTEKEIALRQRALPTLTMIMLHLPHAGNARYLRGFAAFCDKHVLG